jgi:glyoxylase-like metal-dependent hydrolase (beta-lactamase superfamily II)/rhodanese-related sulfurtransferase
MTGGALKDQPSISPRDLAERIAAGNSTTVLDVREDASWSIDGPGLTLLQAPAVEVLADPLGMTESSPQPIVVVCNRGNTAGPVMHALREQGVEAVVLEGGIRGWIGALQSRSVDLGLDGLEMRQIQRPGRGCLSYLLAAGGRGMVVDPAPDPAFYVGLAAELEVRITDVVDTHLHADHLSGARALADQTGATLRLPAPALDRGIAYEERVEPLRDGDEIELGHVVVRAIHLPGHTTDMTGLVVEGRALISGDSLFADGIARPDLQQGDPEGARAMARTLHRTLHERVLSMPGDVVVLPGHTHPGVNVAAVSPTLRQVGGDVGELSLADPAEFAEALLSDMPPRPANYESIIAANSGRHPLDGELEEGGNSCSTR